MTSHFTTLLHQITKINKLFQNERNKTEYSIHTLTAQTHSATVAELESRYTFMTLCTTNCIVGHPKNLVAHNIKRKVTPCGWAVAFDLQHFICL